MAWKFTVDDSCTGCSECVDVCPVEVYELEDGKSVPVKASECSGCVSRGAVRPVTADSV